ncbi:MAG: DEAD/DEAH box helicase, partial [Luteibaculum sp.]
MEFSNFNELNLDDSIIQALDFMGITKPTKIQQTAIPLILEGKDLIACSQTGTGKTASFLIPIIQQCQNKESSEIYSLIICPTRELALQIDQQCDGIGYFSPVSSVTLYGGGDGDGFLREKQALKSGTNILIGTPGKVLSHLNLNPEIGKQIEVFVLDEADRMLDMGFQDDINRIIEALPNRKQNLLFSATMPPSIRTLAKKFQNNPEEISFSISKPAEKINQRAVSIFEDNKVDYLLQHLEGRPELKSIIIFSATKAGAKFISFKFQSNNLSAKSLHSDKEQKEREEILQSFKAKQLRILIATNIAARGIDVENIDLVVNYHVPDEPEDYVHRVGRTARAEKDGEALTLVAPKEQRKWLRIEALIEKEFAMETPDGFKEPRFDREYLKNNPPGKKKGFKGKGKGGKKRFS